jgi:hypothetical protein
MTVKEKWPALHAGLDQIPTRDLQRLERWIVAGKPMITDGNVVTGGGT